MTDTLLAKSQREAGSQSGAVSLRDHTRAVVAAARMILDEISPFLPASIDPDKLRDLTLVGATLHDIGQGEQHLSGQDGTAADRVRQDSVESRAATAA